MGFSWLLLAAALAGCTASTDAPTPTNGSTGGGGNGTALPNATYPLIRLQGCTELFAFIDVPEDLVRPALPPAFVPFGLFPGLAQVWIIALDCEKGSDNATTWGAYSVYMAGITVNVVNTSWGESGYSDHYVLDFATNGDALRAALGFHNISVDAATVGIDRTPLPEAVGGTLWSWDVKAPAWESKFHHRMRAEDTQPDTFASSEWFGTGPYRRLFLDQNMTVDSLTQTGEVVLDGESRLEAALGTSAFGYKGSTWVNSDWAMRVDARVFET